MQRGSARRPDASLPIEVIRAQLTTARIEQRIAQLEDREDSLAGEMRDMMGLPADEQIEVSTEDIPGAAAEASKDAVSDAMANNIDLKQAQAELRAREFKLKGEQGGRWPSFALTGQYNVLSKINNYTDFFNKFQRNNVIFGVQVQIPIFASRTSSAVAFARADFNAASLALQDKRSRDLPGCAPQSQASARGGTGRGSGAAGVAARTGECARPAGAV